MIVAPVPSYVATATGAVHVWTAGTRRREHAPIVLLHHTPGSGASVAALAATLAPRWTLAPDLPGFGASAPLPAGPSIAGWADAVAGVLDRLEVADAVVFGHHAGAAVAARLAVAHPARVRRLILSAPPLVDGRARAELEDRVAPPAAPAADGAHVAAAWARVTAKAPALPLALAHREAVDALAAGAGYAAAYRAVLAHALAADLAALAARGVPTVVTTGPDDPLAPVARRAAALARASFLPLAAGGLCLCDESPAALAALIASAPDEEP